MAVWVVRAGRYGQRENFALENGFVMVGWEGLSDLSKLDLEELKKAIDREYPDRNSRTIGIWAGQAWNFVHEIEVDDLVITPLKDNPTVAVGEVTGKYQFLPDNPEEAKHVRKVKWLNTEVSRTAFDDDILASLGSNLTVFQVRADNAEHRVRSLLDVGSEPTTEDEIEESDSLAEAVNMETQAADQIRKFIDRKFRSHNFAQLIAALLVAKGYTVHASDPGPDGGVDIVAGRGSIGFDAPRIVVQVKSGRVVAGMAVVTALNERIEGFGADVGLLVSWGGFERKVKREIAKRFFKIRLWDSEDVVSELKANYEKLPEDVKAMLPLKEIWALVSEDAQFQPE